MDSIRGLIASAVERPTTHFNESDRADVKVSALRGHLSRSTDSNDLFHETGVRYIVQFSTF